MRYMSILGYMSRHVNEHISKHVNEYISKHVKDCISKHVNEYASEHVNEYASERVNNYIWKHVNKYILKHVNEYVSKHVHNYISKHVNEYMFILLHVETCKWCNVIMTFPDIVQNCIEKETEAFSFLTNMRQSVVSLKFITKIFKYCLSVFIKKLLYTYNFILYQYIFSEILPL